MKKSEAVDMTTGNPGKRILFFALPMIFGNVFQQLYSMVDSAVVGRYVGKQALSIGLGLFLMAIILPLGTILPQLFLKSNEVEVIHIAQEYLRTVAVFYWLCGMQYIMLNLFRGMGKMKISTFSACMDPVMKLILAWILGRAFGRSALWFAWPIGWAAALIVPVICFARGNWMNGKE